MFFGARIKVFDDVIGLGFKQVMVTVFNQKILNFFTANVPFVLAIYPTEGSIGLEIEQRTQRLSLTLNRHFLLGYHYHEAGKA